VVGQNAAPSCIVSTGEREVRGIVREMSDKIQQISDCAEISHHRTHPKSGDLEGAEPEICRLRHSNRGEDFEKIRVPFQVKKIT
jgi:hypothetical protein